MHTPWCTHLHHIPMLAHTPTYTPTPDETFHRARIDYGYRCVTSGCFPGLAESISFSVSALIPPSPIPPNSTLHHHHHHHHPAPNPSQRGGRKQPQDPFPSQQGGRKQPPVESKADDSGKRRSKRLRVTSMKDALADSKADIFMPSPVALCIMEFRKWLIILALLFRPCSLT